MVDFYSPASWASPKATGRYGQAGGEIVFMTRDPREHHQWYVCCGVADLGYNIVHQLSLRVGVACDAARAAARPRHEHALELERA